MKKVCSICKEELEVSLFAKCKNGKYGVEKRCKSCISKQNKEKYIPTGNKVGRRKGEGRVKFMTTEIFIKRAKEKHGEKYDYSKSVFSGSKEYITMICSIHGEFRQSPYDHMSGIGCRECGLRKGNGTLLSTQEFIERASKIHLNKYNYSLVEYKGDNIKVTIICPIHGEFRQLPGAHTRNESGCPKCQESVGERKVRVFLEENNINYIQEKKFKDCKHKRALPFDFYLPEKNIIIEYDGIQHFEPVRFNGLAEDKSIEEFNLIKLKDGIKNEYCKQNNIHLIRIKYNESINSKLKEEII